jgi:hypothetical protein
MIYFVYKPGIRHYVFLFDNTGKRIGVLKHQYADKLIKEGRIISTMERINLIRRLNGLKDAA